MILTLLLIAGLGVAGWIWSVPLTERFWAWWTILSTPASNQATLVPPKGVDAGRRVVTPPSVRPSKAEAHNARGFELAQAGDVEGAIAEFRRAVSADPKNFKAHNNLGVLYKQKGLTAQAINEYQAASKADPANPVPYKNMAILYDEQGRLPEALRSFARYLELAPNASDAEVIRSRVRDLRSKTDNKPAR
jgi:Flp pilus assembly protein TadD